MILVTGASGFVGHKIMEMCKDTIAAPSLRNVSGDTVRRIVEESGADTVIHTAAISDISVCQADHEASYFANVQIPLYLAEACKDRKLICFSSDQVYSARDDEGPYAEDKVKPGNVYAEHKILMEQRVLDVLPSAVMLRAEWMYDYNAQRPNYLMNIINAKEPLFFSSKDFRGVTYLKEVAENMEKVINLPGGAYNFGSETTQSMYEITREFIELIGKKIELHDVQEKHNLWMDCSKAGKYGIKFSSVIDGLARCVNDYQLQKRF